MNDKYLGLVKINKIHGGSLLIVPDNFIWTKACKTGGTSILYGVLQPHCESTILHSSKWKPKEYKFYLDNLTDEELNQQFLFTFVRNPWARTVSLYHYFSDADIPEEFKEFVCKLEMRAFIEKRNIFGQKKDFYIHALPQHYYSHYTGRKYVNFIGKFENLQEDFNVVCDKIGIPRQNLPHKNPTKHKHYTEYYDEETKQIVAELYAKDIEYFGYEFGE